MMQHVATAKSEIAAFATSAESNSIADSGSNAQFGQLFEGQKGSNSVVVKSSPSQAHSPNKTASQPIQEEVKSEAQAEESPISAAAHKGRVGGAEKENSQATPSEQSDKVTNAGNDDIVKEVKDTKGSADGEPNDININEQSVPDSSKTQMDKKLFRESSNIVAEDWILLIDNLKRLESSDSPRSSSEELDTSTVDQELSDEVDKELLEQLAENPFADQTRLSLDGFKLPQVEDKKHPRGQDVISKRQVEQTMSNNEEIDQSGVKKLVLASNSQTEENITKLVDKALSEVMSIAEFEERPKLAVTQEASKLLLQQPEVLQVLMSQMSDSSQKVDSSDQGTLSSIAESGTKEASMLAKQQLESVSHVDLTQDENMDLLKALVLETEGNKSGTKVTKEMVEPGVSDTVSKRMQTIQPEPDINKVVPIVDSAESIEQEIQVAQSDTSNQSRGNKAALAAVDNDITRLLNLPDGKLDKVLENIAQRVFEVKNVEGSISPEQIAKNVATPRVAEIVNSIESSSKEFVAVLKSGLEEFKNQLSQGREPGIDLKALVADTLGKTAESTPAAVAKTMVNSEQIVTNVSQVLNLAQSVGRTIEERHDQMYSATVRDAAQVQGEQTKQIQVSQLESKFEKAINVAKPEGHQQLAEKVRWMVNTKNLVAEIRLDPAELGSVHVKVAMSGESATVNFVVQSQQARDAVDTATPRLREMLAEKGIELGQSSVREESDGQQGQDELAGQGGSGSDETENIEAPEQVLAQQNIVNGALGGIDYFV